MTLLMRDKEQQRLGKYTEKVSTIKKFKDNIDYDMLIRITDGQKETLDRIIYLIDTHPDWDCEDIADAVINEEE